jgi:hypothetical protein
VIGIGTLPIKLPDGDGHCAAEQPRIASCDARPRVTRVSIGAAPAIALVAALGLILVALGDNAAREGERGLQLLFWGGLALIFAPIAFRLLGAAAHRPERIALVLTLGLSLFIVKVLRSPAEFVRFDEFGWWRAAHEVLVTGHTFNGNPLNPATAGYPALSTFTAAVSQLTGLSIFHSGLIVIGVARAILILALFLFLEKVIGSSRGAGVGIAVYACNPSFLYFDAQFGYESLALMSAAAFLLISLRWSLEDRLPLVQATTGVAGVLLLLTCGLTLTHHMTSLAVLAFLSLWLGARALTLRNSARANGERQMNGPLVPTLLLALTIIIWLSLAAGHVTVAELGGLFSRAFNSVTDLILGNRGSKQLFSGAGQSVGLAIRGLIVAYVILTLILIIAGLLTIWRARVRAPLWLALSTVAMFFPITLGLRLTLASSEISQRASGFVFLGVAFLAGLLTVSRTPPAWRPRTLVGARLAVTVLALMSFIGSFLLGESQATRQPGAYLVGAEDRSVTPEGIAAAEFASAHLPARSRVLTDRTNATLLGSYGGLDPVFGRYAGISLPRILFSSRFDDTDRRALRGQSLALIVVDRRLSRELPLIGYYVESDEPGAFVLRRPVSGQSLEKFASVANVSAIYTNGPIVIYDTTALLR